MRYLALLIFFLSSFSLHAQIRKFYGQVIDVKDKKGIPRAVIEVKDRFTGFYCGEEGYFSFEGNADSIKTFVFYRQGYEPKEVAVSKLTKDSIVIELKRGYVDLDEVVIPAKKSKIKERILGKRKLHHNGGAYSVNGDEMAIYLEADPRKNGTLKDVYFYITGEGQPTSKFRVHVYQKDSTMLTPGFEITDSPIIAHAEKGAEWVRVDVSDRHIPLKDGIFVSLEWIAGYGNDDETWHQDTLMHYYHSGSAHNDFNGAVLGMTWNYGIQSITYTSSARRREYWDYSNPGANRRGLIRVSHWINPMIYCTYTYAKK